MTFFQRIKTPFTESPTEQARLQPRTSMVGELLQERREDLGLDLDEIGAMLRIKPSYLASLEQGRTHDLPGPTYAIGFVRAYSDFLGLDAEQVLARFKTEAAGVTARPDLALPVPLGERSLPGGALVLVALILALCGYGIWYYLSTEERDRPARVADVPAALQAPQPTPVLVAPPSPQAMPRSTDDNAGATSLARLPSSPPASLYGAAASPPQASPPPSAAPGDLQGRSITANTPVLPQIAAAKPAALPAAPPAPVDVAQPQPAPAQAASAAPPATAPAAAATATQAGRVTIRAVADCWIQVRAADQSIVFSRVLKSGEVYAVPARSGLSLRTGNAGALEIAVDGKTAPSIGGIGALRRDVALDPGELAAGTAVHG